MAGEAPGASLATAPNNPPTHWTNLSTHTTSVAGDTPLPRPSYGRHYSTETYDRDTGELVALDLGLWMTLAEFTTLMGVGMRSGRLILAEIGLIEIEDRRYRLKPEHEHAGLGKRLRSKGSRFPFDVLSPAGQAYAKQRWDAAHERIVQRRSGSPLTRQAADALTEFSARRSEPMSVQMGVCWLLDHFPYLSTREIAAMLSVTEAIVFKWSAKRTVQRGALLDRRRQPIASDPQR